MTVHRQQTITDNLRFLPVNKHMHLCSNNSFRILPIYQSSENIIEKEAKESMSINLLKPGLNS